MRLRLWECLALIGIAGCFWGSDPTPPVPVEEPSVLALGERIGSFYALLEGEPLDTQLTYEDQELRTYFREDRDFTDYYAALANTVRREHFRNSIAQRVIIREFRLDGSDLAQVDILLIGQHERVLIFWDLEIEQTDVWRREAGDWFLSPDKL